MEKWRAIDYERELKRVEKSNIPEISKKLILRYKSHRIANGVSVAMNERDLH